MAETQRPTLHRKQADVQSAMPESDLWAVEYLSPYNRFGEVLRD